MKHKTIRSMLLFLVLFFGLMLTNQNEVYAATNVDKLSIVSDGSTDEASYGVHSFLVYKNTSDSDQTIAGVTVNPKQSITIGTYGNQSSGKGVYVNLEAYYAQNYNSYANRVSLTTDISSAELKKIQSKINKCNKWTYTKNCSWFAKEVWNTVAPKSKQLSAGVPPTPKTLSDNIKKNSTYKTNISLPTVKNTYRYNTSGKSSSSSASTKKNSSISSWGS